jgi:hypothetical protein
MPATGDRPRRTGVDSAIGSGESVGQAHASGLQADGLVPLVEWYRMPANKRGLKRFQCLQGFAA